MFQNATILNGDCKSEILIFIADNVWRYAAFRLNISNFPAYMYINLIHINVIFTTNCGMQYERVL